MTYAGPLLRLVLGGDLYAPTEQWTFSLHLSHTVTNAAPPETVPAAVIAACSTYFSTAGMISSRATLRWIKLNQIGIDGRYTEPETVRHDYASAVAGTASAANYAPQTALAITLRTGVDRGRAARGRYFLPIPGYQLGANGLLAVNDRTFYATAATTFLNALNASMPSQQARVVVASDVGQGLTRLVTHVSVGGALDTIRSRRNAMPEAWVDGADLA